MRATEPAGRTDSKMTTRTTDRGGGQRGHPPSANNPRVLVANTYREMRTEPSNQYDRGRARTNSRWKYQENIPDGFDTYFADTQYDYRWSAVEIMETYGITSKEAARWRRQHDKQTRPRFQPKRRTVPKSVAPKVVWRSVDPDSIPGPHRSVPFVI